MGLMQRFAAVVLRTPTALTPEQEKAITQKTLENQIRNALGDFEHDVRNVNYSAKSLKRGAYTVDHPHTPDTHPATIDMGKQLERCCQAVEMIRNATAGIQTVNPRRAQVLTDILFNEAPVQRKSRNLDNELGGLEDVINTARRTVETQAKEANAPDVLRI